MTDTPFDAVQVGYGPVSQVLATMLGRQRRRVAGSTPRDGSR